METKAIIVAAAIIIATAGLATSSLALNANAAPNGDTVTTCTHNGNGGDKCTGGQSTTVTTCTKVKGKYECTSSR
jgi:hypothetical protein